MSPAGDTPRPPRRITPFERPQYTDGARRFPLSDTATVALVHDALEEDQAFNDVTTIATVLSTRHVRARLVAREAGVIAGVPLALAAFRLLDEQIEIRIDREDGTIVEPGATVLHLSGHARGILAAERTALNFMQHLSGIASITRKYVEAVRGTHAAILDASSLARRFPFALKSDIRQFFPSIDHAVLMNRLQRKIRCRRTLARRSRASGRGWRGSAANRWSRR